jgi:hypothetical protein
MRRAIVLLGLLLGGSVLAQESSSYKLTEHTFNAGGHPAEGVVLTSTSFRVTLDAIGDGVTTTALSSASFKMRRGFGLTYIPPGQVTGLLLTNDETLEWNPERSVGIYNLYRDLLSNLRNSLFGICKPPELPTETTLDTDLPPLGDGYFYLVTAENPLDEEGTKGFQSEGTERLGANCP